METKPKSAREQIEALISKFEEERDCTLDWLARECARLGFEAAREAYQGPAPIVGSTDKYERPEDFLAELTAAERGEGNE